MLVWLTSILSVVTLVWLPPAVANSQYQLDVAKEKKRIESLIAGIQTSKLQLLPRCPLHASGGYVNDLLRLTAIMQGLEGSRWANMEMTLYAEVKLILSRIHDSSATLAQNSDFYDFAAEEVSALQVQSIELANLLRMMTERAECKEALLKQGRVCKQSSRR